MASKQAGEGFFKSWAAYFNDRFGPDWREKDKFLKAFFKELDEDSQKEAP